MEAKDLMIGDWVMVTECVAEAHFRDYPDKILSISDGLVGLESDGLETIKERIAPIPLTAEILGKNFKSTELPDDPYGAYFFGGDDKIKIYIREHTNGLWKVDVDEIEIGGIRSWSMYVSNVHELQHAIRLCKIDKEIKL